MRAPLPDVTLALEPWVSTLPTSDADLAFLERAFRTTPVPRLNYDHLAESFASRYFMANVAKAWLVLERCPPSGESQRIADLGCGSGSATVALLTYLDARRTGPREVDVVLVDASARQLALARKALPICAARLRHLRPRVREYVDDIHHWVSSRRTLEDAEIVLLGHVLSESGPRGADALADVISAARPDAAVYVLDQTDDAIWSRVLPIVEDSLEPHESGRIVVPNQRLPLARDARARLRQGVAVQFVAVRKASNPVLPSLVRRYLGAWHRKDTDSLAEVFAHDATYCERPFAPAIEGLAAIERYWRERVVPQRSPRVVVSSVAYTDATAFIEWRAVFGRAEAEIELRGAMVLELDASGHRIGRLREYFVSRASEPRDGEGATWGRRRSASTVRDSPDGA